MPVQIGQNDDHGFDAPMGLLSDCHRRIEKFLGAQLQVATTAHGGALDDRQREALEKSLRYFANAAPWHTADEEQSLFPRMRESNDPDVQEALAKMQQLESDHRHAEAHHAEVDRLIQRWLDDNALSEADMQQLLTLLETLQATYREHIAFEDQVLFPLAERLLDAEQVRALGREMAIRRGIGSNQTEPRCKHARQNRERES